MPPSPSTPHRRTEIASTKPTITLILLLGPTKTTTKPHSLTKILSLPLCRIDTPLPHTQAHLKHMIHTECGVRAYYALPYTYCMYGHFFQGPTNFVFAIASDQKFAHEKMSVNVIYVIHTETYGRYKSGHEPHHDNGKLDDTLPNHQTVPVGLPRRCRSIIYCSTEYYDLPPPPDFGALGAFNVYTPLISPRHTFEIRWTSASTVLRTYRIRYGTVADYN